MTKMKKKQGGITILKQKKREIENKNWYIFSIFNNNILQQQQ